MILGGKPVVSKAGDVLSSFDLPAYSSPRGLAWDGTYLWNSDSGEEITRYDTNGNEISSFSTDFTPLGLAWDGDYLWVADYDNDKIKKLDTSGSVKSSFSSPGSLPYGLAWDGTYLWHSDYGEGKIYKLDTSGDVIYSFSTNINTKGLAWDGTYLWVADCSDDKIYKFNVDGDVISSFSSPGSCPMGLAWDGSNLWNSDDTTRGEKIYELEVRPDPSPDVISVDYPSSITIGDWAAIRVNVTNNGDGDSDWQSINVSFPTNPSTSDISIDSDSLANGASLHPPGSEVGADYGRTTVITDYPMVEGNEQPWNSGSDEYLNVKVKPESTGIFTFYVKTVASQEGKWYADPAKDGSESPEKDQQNEYVWKHTIDVVPEHDPVEPDPETARIRFSDKEIVLGETFTVFVEGRNDGGTAGEWSSVTLSFPELDGDDDKSRASIIDHSFNAGDEYTVRKDKGDDIWDKDGDKISAKYVLVEGGTSGGGTWDSGESNFIEVRVEPKEAGKFPIYIRTTLTDDANSTRKFTDPSSSSYTDQQGFRVYRRIVTVKPEHEFSALSIADLIVSPSRLTEGPIQISVKVKNGSDTPLGEGP